MDKNKKPTGPVAIEDIFYVTADFQDAAKNAKEIPNGAIKVRIKATHGGFVNYNHTFYTEELFKNSLSSFTKPFNKPLLVNHSDNQNDVIGRIIDARLVSIPNAPKGSPTCYIEVDAYVSGYENIERIKDQRLYTVSVKAVSIPKKTKIRCSICDAILEPTWSSLDAHEHQRGEVYDGHVCYHILEGKMEYTHIGYVPEPADAHTDTSIIQDSLNSHTLTTEAVTMNETDLNKTDQSSQSGDGSQVAQDGTDASPEQLPGSNSDTTTASENTEKQSSPESTTEDSFGDVTQEELDELIAIDLTIEDELEEDKKLSAKKREDLPSGSFCGPNRSFPVPDCAHVTAALRLLGRAKVSESTKEKIHACVMKKAESLKCDTPKKDEADRTTQTIEDYLNLDIVKAHIDQNYYKKSEIDQVVQATAKVILDETMSKLDDADVRNMYDALKKDFVLLEEKLRDTRYRLNNNRILALKTVKALSDSSIKDINSVAVTTEELENFEDELNKVLADLVETQPTPAAQPTPEPQPATDSKKTMSVVSVSGLSPSAKAEILDSLLNK